MHASVGRLVAGLLLLQACAGEVGEPTTSVESTEVDAEDARRWNPWWWRGRRDGGGVFPSRDAGAPIGRRDASTGPVTGARPEPSLPEPDPNDEEPAPSDPGEPEAPDPGTAPGGTSGGGTTASCGGKDFPLAAGLRIREIALYQTVKVTLFKDGTWVNNRPLPVVQNKKALVRVFAEPLPGYARRPVRGVLSLQNGQTVSLTSERTLAAASSDADANSTFNFQVPAAQIGSETKLSVALQETSCSASAGSAGDARVSAQTLGAANIGKLRVVIVPIQMNGRLPKTDATEIARMRDALLAYYPVPDVEVTVRSRPLSATAVSGTDSRGWSNVLNQVLRERSADKPASDVYYFGLMQPAGTFREYCSRGCIMGIAPQTVRVMSSSQGGLGASFADAQTLETMVHELGHAHGRGHAPCVQGGSIQGVDQQFPDKSGATAVWGWDSRSDKLLAPTYKDIMGYCHPNWISGYTYSALAARAQQVNQRALILSPADGTRWHQLIAYGSGGARWGGLIESSYPGGEPESAIARDASGRTVAKIEVVRIPLSHSEDQLVYVPEPQPGWASIALSDREIVLSSVEPASP